MSLIKKIANNAILMSYASRFVAFGNTIILLPLVLNAYNSVEQSFYWLTTTVVTFAMLADSGFGSALVRAVAYFKAGSDYLPKNKKEYDDSEVTKPGSPNLEQLQNLLTTSNSIYAILAALSVVLIGFGVLIFWNIMVLANHRIDFWIGYFTLIPNCAQLILIVKWKSFLRGLNFVAYSERINVYFSVVRLISFAIMLAFKLSPMYLLLYGLFSTAIRLRVYKNFVKKWFKTRGYYRKSYNTFRFDKKIFASLWPQTWRLAGIFWGNFLVENGNSFIVAQISEPILMAKFLFTTRILSFAKTFSQTTLTANLPVIYKFGAEKNFKMIRQKASHYLFLALLIIFGSYLFVGAWGNPILDILNKFKIIETDTRFVPTFLFIFMALTIILDMHSTFHASIYSSTNHIPFLIPSLVSGAAIVGLGYFYVLNAYGLIGIIMLRFFVQLSFNNWYATWLSLKLLKWPFFKYLYEVPYEGAMYYGKRLKSLIIRK